jgi:hypothetical protein
MEVEVKGPIVSLAAAGGNYTFTENWWAAKVRAPVLDVDSVGAIANRLSYNSTTHCLSAIYGVFYQGTAKVAYIDAQGQLLTEGQPHTVSPLTEFQLQEIVAIPDSAKTIEVRIYSTKDELIGTLERKNISALLTGVKNVTSEQPSEFCLEQNFPNPFNPSTTIAYSLPEKSSVEVMIYDLLGREIKSFMFNAQSAGYQRVAWNGTNNFGNIVSSGIYIYRVTASSIRDGSIISKSAKIMLLK